MPTKKHKTNNLPIQNHKTLVFWAADCAEHVFALFEKKYPKDKRPCKAIETAKKKGDVMLHGPNTELVV